MANARVKQLLGWYHRTKLWIVVTVLVIATVEPLLAHDLKWQQKLLAFGLGGSFLIVLEVLHSLNTKLPSHTLGNILETLRSIDNKLRPKQGFLEFTSLLEAVPKISAIINEDRASTIEVDILASDGGFIVNLIPAIRQAVTRAKVLRITVRLVSEKSPIIEQMPGHWKKTVIDNLERLSDMNGPLVIVDVIRYDYLPCVAGLLINDKHLFLGFYVWHDNKGKVDLDAAHHPHVYYSTDDTNADVYFSLFRGWSKLALRSGERFPS